jgi:S-DNA-T family DNA segregation ATPase FtsK/SpoIIIE
MALRVASRTDSLVAIDAVGAEHLLKHGDMLFQLSGTTEHLQAPLITSDEVFDIVRYIRENNSCEFNGTICAELQKSLGGENVSGAGGSFTRSNMLSEEDEQMVKDAFDVFEKFNVVSANFLQRKFSIGNPKAARIVDWLTDNGCVKKSETENKKILAVTKEEFLEILRKVQNGGDENE